MRSNRISYIEQVLGVRLPIDYARFISETGFDTANGMEIYGYTENMTDPEKVPCVIGATRLYRTIYALASQDVVIAGGGVDDRIIVLNTGDGRIYEVGFHVRQCMARSFEDWHDAICLNQNHHNGLAEKPV